MKANELRLGNLLQWKDNKSQLECCLNFFKDSLFWQHISNKELEPIPLTEEWLLKFGFEKYDTYKYSKNHFYFRKIGDEFQTEVGECLYKTIDYVHQLQNLYFALNDEELTMK
jgi:hypothetical protein